MVIKRRNDILTEIQKFTPSQNVFFSAENLTLRQDISSFCRDMFNSQVFKVDIGP